MTDLDPTSLLANERHLAAALAWLRLRLVDVARPGEVPPDTLAAARAALDLAAASDPPPLTVALARRLRLVPFEQDLLLLCAAAAWDPQVLHLCAELHGGPERAHVSFALALAVLDDPAWDVLSTARPLLGARLLSVVDLGSLPVTQCPLRVDPRVLHALRGIQHVDDHLRVYAHPQPATPLPPLPSHTLAARAVADGLTRPEGPPIVQLVGDDGDGCQLVAQLAADALGRALWRFPAALLPGGAESLDQLARLWVREAAFAPVLALLDARTHGAEAARFAALLARLGEPALLEAAESVDLPPGSLRVDVARPDTGEQRTAWMTLVGAAPDDAARLAAHFDLGLGALVDIAAAARNAGAHDHATLWQICRRRSQPRLDGLAERIEPRARWHDLVLPPAEAALLQQIAAQVRLRAQVYDDWGFRGRRRGLGITALFTGESGTGKTLAAEVLAAELDLSLYRVDLANVISKYIGETEKNLRRVFDAAEAGGAVLFFDEADALFGKRSEVRDSHDRYANIEVGYLLQRMEAHRGLAVLATNLRDALDAAFLRRLRFVVRFPFPGPAERAALWQRAFPPGAPAHDLDLRSLSEVCLSGGSIATCAMNAAFLAAAEGTPVTRDIVRRALQGELRKLDRPVHEADARRPGGGP